MIKLKWLRKLLLVFSILLISICIFPKNYSKASFDPDKIYSEDTAVIPSYSYDEFVNRFVAALNSVASKAYSSWQYGSSNSLPPCEDGLISCDRMISRALWDIGFTDQGDGGFTCGGGVPGEYLITHGFEYVTDDTNIQAGDIVRVDNKKHVFVVSEFDSETGNCKIFDMGCNDKIRSLQPFSGKLTGTTWAVPMGGNRPHLGYYRFQGGSTGDPTIALNYLKTRINIKEGKPEKYDIYIDGNDLDPTDGLEVPALQTSLDYVIYNNDDSSNIDFFDTKSFNKEAHLKKVKGKVLQKLRDSWDSLSRRVKSTYRVLLYLSLGMMTTSLIFIGIMIVKGTMFKDTITDLMKKNMGVTDDDLPNEYYQKKFTNQWIFTLLTLILIILAIILSIALTGVISKMTTTYAGTGNLLDSVIVYAKAIVNKGSGNSSSQEGLGIKRDIDENTLDKNGNKLVDRMTGSDKSLHGKELSELVDKEGNRLYLSYLEIPYYDFNGNVQTGEMVVHKDLADEVLLIFKDLYDIQYPIQRMELVDNYDGSDSASIDANNTSAFNYRGPNGTDPSPNNLSNHALGECIDINPLVNPYIYDYWVEGATPHTSHDDKFIDRDGMSDWSEVEKKAKADDGTPAYDVFMKYGWHWLQYTNNGKDLDSQHFEKLDPSTAQTIDWSNMSSGSGTGSKTSSSSSASSSSSSASSNSQLTEFTKYQLTDQELTALTAVACSEPGWGDLKGASVEASLMANLFELQHNGSYNGQTGGTGLYNMVRYHGWFAQVDEYMDTGCKYDYNPGNFAPVTEEEKAVVKSVLVDGKRTIPGYIDEHDSWSDKDFTAYKSKDDRTDITNSKEAYTQFETYIINNHGSQYTFWGFANPDNPDSDAFGYISEENRQRIGEFHYEFDGSVAANANKTIELSFTTTFEGLYMMESNFDWDNYLGHNLIYMAFGFILTVLKIALYFIFYFRMLIIAGIIAITPILVVINGFMKIKGNEGILKKWSVLYLECLFLRPLIQIIYRVFARNNNKTVEENPFYIMFVAGILIIILVVYIKKIFRDFKKKNVGVGVPDDPQT